MFNPGANRASFMITVFSSWLLSVAYLRTRALWVCWGWHFAWNTSMCLLFGLPVSGITQFSPVIQSNTVGPSWMTGGDYGPEASTVAAIVLLFGIFVVYRTTRNLAYLHTQPVIVPAGIPVDLDAMSSTLAPHHPVDSPSRRRREPRWCKSTPLPCPPRLEPNRKSRPNMSRRRTRFASLKISSRRA